ncbi:uncharacterized protein RCC_09181 [Ramularia collo-cygni]|uniref:Uncharacterized protein n=1 Tax=Ramularia collo-cygni TaxID=112498 RepID=A0A2D3UZI9_9PEZI|nr:uncharacterized protein RCC_09181 [Ramularia collo-cygni]CZT23467.1 uncharacterized protein RCC_09181 [Ramularia collo-cygni]
MVDYEKLHFRNTLQPLARSRGVKFSSGSMTKARLIAELKALDAKEKEARGEQDTEEAEAEAEAAVELLKQEQKAAKATKAANHYVIRAKDNTFRPYQPGPDSLDFLLRSANPHAASGENNADTYLAAKLVVLLNDAIYQLGLPGFFVHTLPANQFRCLAGGALQAGFVLRINSVEEQNQWENADLMTKMQMASLHWKPQNIGDRDPVMPLHMSHGLTLRLPKSSRSWPSGFPRLEIYDHSRITRKGGVFTPGLYLVPITGTLQCLPAEDWKAACKNAMNGELCLRQDKAMGAVDRRKQLSVDGGDDPVRTLTATITKYMLEAPQDVITLHRLRSWGNWGKLMRLAGLEGKTQACGALDSVAVASVPRRGARTEAEANQKSERQQSKKAKARGMMTRSSIRG